MKLRCAIIAVIGIALLVTFARVTAASAAEVKGIHRKSGCDRAGKNWAGIRTHDRPQAECHLRCRFWRDPEGELPPTSRLTL